MFGVRRWETLLLPAALGLLSLVGLLVAGGAVGAVLLLVLASALGVVVGLHRRACRETRGVARRAGYRVLRRPGQLLLAVFVVVGGGALFAVVASMLVAAVVSPLVGDGSVVVRLSLVVFALGPCLSLGRRCGEWWAFLGAGGVLPLVGFALLVDGALSTGFGFMVVAALTTAFALAVGSLRAVLALTNREYRRRRGRVLKTAIGGGGSRVERQVAGIASRRVGGEPASALESFIGVS